MNLNKELKSLPRSLKGALSGIDNRKDQENLLILSVMEKAPRRIEEFLLEVEAKPRFCKKCTQGLLGWRGEKPIICRCVIVSLSKRENRLDIDWSEIDNMFKDKKIITKE